MTPNRKIRLDPGMKPCNEFHVREYSADEFGAALDKAFPEVAVQGLFACHEIAEVEYGRLARAKDAMQRRAPKRPRPGPEVPSRSRHPLHPRRRRLPRRALRSRRAKAAMGWRNSWPKTPSAICSIAMTHWLPPSI